MSWCGRLFGIAVSAAVVLVVASCSDSQSVVIDGKAEGLSGKKVYVERIEPTFTRTLDSVSIGTNGNFSFKLKPKDSEPYFLNLRTDSVYLATLLVEKGERIKLAYANGSYTTEGSRGSALLDSLLEMQQHVQKHLDSIYKLEQQAALSSDDYLRAMNKAFIDQKRSHIRFIASNPTSYASIMAIYQNFYTGVPMFNRTEDLAYYKLLIDSLQLKYPKAVYVEKLKNDYQRIKNELELAAKFSNIAVAEGLPDINLPDTNGNKQALSSLKGKVVILHFWSAAVKGSQLQNRELINLYEKYHSKGLEVYQVSLDKDRIQWRRVVEEQDLPWISVCDGFGEDSPVVRMYNLQAVPTVFLVGRNGDVVAKNSWGDELEKKVASLLK